MGYCLCYTVIVRFRFPPPSELLGTNARHPDQACPWISEHQSGVLQIIQRGVYYVAIFAHHFGYRAKGYEIDPGAVGLGCAFAVGVHLEMHIAELERFSVFSRPFARRCIMVFTHRRPPSPADGESWMRSPGSAVRYGPRGRRMAE